MLIKLEPGATHPTRAHAGDAGLDLYSMESFVIPPMAYHGFETGVHADIPYGYCGQVESRSGLNFNHGIFCPNGTVDSGYKGTIRVNLYNMGTAPYLVNRGDRIAQLVVYPIWVTGAAIDERGENGFGSSGR